MTKEEAKQLKDLIDKMTEENGEIPFLKSDDVKEVTEDQYVELGSLEPGDKFSWNGWTLTVLDKREDGVFVLTDEIVDNMSFDTDDCNNWKTSTLRRYLNNEFKEGLDDKDKLVEFERDLTSEDGLKDYGTCMDYVSLITTEEYRKYRYLIDNKDDWWWTCTAYSTPYSGYSSGERSVNTDGSLSGYDAFSGNNGVSPTYVLLSSLKVRRVSK